MKRITEFIPAILSIIVAFIYLSYMKIDNKNFVLNEITTLEERHPYFSTENLTEENKQFNNLIEITEETNNRQDESIEQVNKQIDDKIIGTIKIDEINFEGIVYEGTSQDILRKGVGHFKNSPYLNGNVCLAAHNTETFWAELKDLNNGDKITYESFLGTKEYIVYDKAQIDETDWLKLEDTNENTLTLITCVKGERGKRLCVQAKEII